MMSSGISRITKNRIEFRSVRSVAREEENTKMRMKEWIRWITNENRSNYLIVFLCFRSQNERVDDFQEAKSRKLFFERVYTNRSCFFHLLNVRLRGQELNICSKTSMYQTSPVNRLKASKIQSDIFLSTFLYHYSSPKPKHFWFNISVYNSKFNVLCCEFVSQRIKIN